jgi:hypothetical protein
VLFDGITANFTAAVARVGLDDERLKQRFKVFCFKHDLEVLILACEEQLKARLGVDELEVIWTKPVEDQNDIRYPKRVVGELFERYKSRYEPAVDAPLILGAADLERVIEACPQCFAPFVEFLVRLPAV